MLSKTILISLILFSLTAIIIGISFFLIPLSRNRDISDKAFSKDISLLIEEIKKLEENFKNDLFQQSQEILSIIIGKNQDLETYRNIYSWGLISNTQLSRSDDSHSGLIHLKSEFTYFDLKFANLSINVNGYITLGREASIKVLSSDSNLANTAIIFPFLTDFDLRVSGTILYKEERNPLILKLIKLDTNLLDKNFEPNWSFIATWNRAPSHNYYQNSSITNTFQVVLTTDGVKSFIVFNYGKLMFSNEYAKAGFYSGNYMNFYLDEYSNSKNLKNIMNRSNVNKSGVFIFQVDSSTKFKNLTLNSY